MYLKTKDSKIDSGADTYYQKINMKDDTWQSVLDLIENELEAHYCHNSYSDTHKIEGIKFSIEIINELPDDIEYVDSL